MNPEGARPWRLSFQGLCSRAAFYESVAFACELSDTQTLGHTLWTPHVPCPMTPGAPQTHTQNQTEKKPSQTHHTGQCRVLETVINSHKPEGGTKFKQSPSSDRRKGRLRSNLKQVVFSAALCDKGLPHSLSASARCCRRAGPLKEAQLLNY